MDERRDVKKKVLVVGAGLGGLATALRLAKKGYEVEIVEKNSNAGGRLNQIKKDGFTFDTGPSFFAMSYEFEDFARECGIALPFEHYALDPLYSVNFRKDRVTYHLHRDIGKLASQFKQVEPDFENRMKRYLDKCGQVYRDTNFVIKTNYDSLPDYLSALAKANPFLLPLLWRSFWKQVSRYFDSNDAREIVSLVSFFLGKTPFDTSAVYTLLSYTEFVHDGYYNVVGGMYRIAEGVVRELEKENVRIHYGVEIVDFVAKDRTVEYLLDGEGRKWTADIVVVNADAAVFRGRVFRRRKYSPEMLDRMDWTMGTLTIYLGIKCTLPQLNHHNYYLGDDFTEYAHRVFNDPSAAEKPYYYVNVLSRTNPDCAPEGCESLFFVCPVPDLRYKSNWDDRDAIVDGIIDDFSNRTGRNIRNEIVSRTVYTPIEWRDRFNLHRGSALGLAHNMMQTGGFRPKNFDEEFGNVFYVGASTVPGGGLPMVVIGSKLVTERVERFCGNP